MTDDDDDIRGVTVCSCVEGIAVEYACVEEL